ncbi:hypothetical protein [Noviherbaspirillum pedocola]|uniref:Uncharacterized protein n=1 Tax=Noviherbaspirillum pedocola TaxID=2801341 RepID=A0A934W774_9BURK|nr:hypothetical protein [Noviherbaspirillum pedocola]MBK4737082.1 hypothetical protein [Noviherbaspirillum pedocola]
MVLPALSGLYRLLPKDSCTYFGTLNVTNEKPLDFSATGSGVQFGDKTWQIRGGSELVVAVTDGTAYGYEPGRFTVPLYFYHSETNDNFVTIAYARNRKILGLTAVDKDKSMVTCTFGYSSSKFFPQSASKS